jgi:molybdate transport system substrate-binding protein
LANTLVLIVTADNTTITTMSDLTQPGVHHVAFGDPATIPADTYAKEYLDKLNLWERRHPGAVK